MNDDDNRSLKIGIVVCLALFAMIAIWPTHASAQSYDGLCTSKGFNSYTPDSKQVILGNNYVECCITKWTLTQKVTGCELIKI